MASKEQVNIKKLPQHIAVIMDGNGRWAQKHGNKRIFGHQSGVVAVRETVEAAAELGIGYLTLYAFSTENWNRPRDEVDGLMMLLVKTIHSEMDTLMKNNVRLSAIGDIASLPQEVNNELQSAIEKTSVNTGLTLLLALSYSGRWEILNAVKEIAKDYKNDSIDINDIDQDRFIKYLNTAEYPDPELLIRTSGEYRVSNFLLWQVAYCELYFTDVLWPEFRKQDFYDALVDFQGRERRFGKTSSQINNE